MNEITTQIMDLIIPALVTAIGVIVTWLLNELRKWTKSKTDNQTIDTAFNQFEKITKGLVIRAEQVIKTFNDDGKITKDEAERIKRIVLYDVKKQLPDATGVILKKVVNDLDALIDSKIEETVYLIKQKKLKEC